MRKIPSFLILIFLLTVMAICPAMSVEYMGSIREAISQIELGNYDAAAQSVEQALAQDDTDPLGNTTLGVIYFHTGKLDEANRQFDKVLSSQPNDWRVYYAKGVIALVRKRSDEAKKQFAAARVYPDAELEISALERYLGHKGAQPKELLPIEKETEAMAAVARGDQNTAIKLFTELLESPATPGFYENRSPLVTFDAKNQIALPNGKLTWKPMDRKDATVVSGIVTIKANILNTAGISFLNVYVDDVFTGATNYDPFEIDINTRNYPNGLHQIRIEGKNDGGVILNKKSVWVRVSNPNPIKTEPRSSSTTAELSQRLWNCIRVSESRRMAHYQLGKIYLDEGDTENATKQLEYTVAYDANFLDARKLLQRLRGGQPVYIELSQGIPGSKLIALTFDDGPNERTAEMLEMLASLNVPATFFVVGFRAEAQPELTRRMLAAGHQIENHTYTHPNLTTLKVDEVEVELAKSAAVIRAITGKPSIYFRPPGGHADEVTKQAALRQGFTGVFWTIACSPFEGAKCDELADYVINNACDGAIILMHNGEPATTSALPRIVKTLRNQGYRFVTLSEMVSETSSRN